MLSPSFLFGKGMAARMRKRERELHPLFGSHICPVHFTTGLIRMVDITLLGNSCSFVVGFGRYANFLFEKNNNCFVGYPKEKEIFCFGLLKMT